METSSLMQEVFVGRNDVLEQLRSSLDYLMTVHGQVILVAGEAGIGKTWVVNRFLDSISPARKPHTSPTNAEPVILRAKCNPSSGPYSPFAELLDQLPKTHDERVNEILKGWARDLGPKLLEGVVPYLGPLLGEILRKLIRGSREWNATTTLPNQTYQFLQLLERLSKAFPLILFIDDLHWADEASINLLSSLAQHSADSRILLIGTYRPHDIVEKSGYPIPPFSRVLLELQHYNLCVEIALEQFAQDEVTQFLNIRFPGNKFSDDIGEILFRETNGNPLFVDLAVRLLKDQGHIFPGTDDIWSAKLPDVMPIPNGVRATIKARLQNLDEHSRIILYRASALGEQFRSRILAEIMGERHLDTLRSLSILESIHDLVKQRFGADPSEIRPNWEFKHAFVHDTLYSMLAADELTELHRSAAQALVSQFPGSTRELAAELAQHYEMAKRYDKAAASRLIAAQRAYDTLSYREQSEHCEKGIADIELLAPEKVNRRELVLMLSGLAHACRRVINLEKEETIALRLRQMANESGDVIAGIEGCWGLVHVNSMRARKNEQITFAEEAWNIARNSNEAHHLVRVAGLVQLGVHKLQPEYWREHLDDTVDFCRQKNAPLLLSKAIQCRGIVAFSEGENERALSLFREAIAVAQNIDKSDKQLSKDYPFAGSYYLPYWYVSDCFEYIGRIHRQRGDWQAAIENFRQVYDRKVAEGNMPGMAGLLNVIAETQLMAGENKVANSTFQQSWTIAQQCDSSELRAIVLSTGILIGLEENDTAQVRQRLELFEDIIRSWNARWTWHVVQRVRGILSMRTNAGNEASKQLSDGLKVAETENDFGLVVKYNLNLAELNLLRGELQRALSYAEVAVRMAKEHELSDLGEAYVMSARIRLKLGTVSEAYALAGQAVEYFESRNLPHKELNARNLKRECEGV